MNLPSGVIIKPLTKHEDSRGYLTELFRSDELDFEGENFNIQQGYFSVTGSGIRRGPHQHEFQSDYFCFLDGTFLLELWDARFQGNEPHNYQLNDNNIFNKKHNLNEQVSQIVIDNVKNSYYSIEVGENNPCAVIIPPGVVHAYTNLSDHASFTLNFPDRLYKGQNKLEKVDEIRYEENPLFKERN
jgi:dTDP-4-dehydrorhamnose 3,5-epimerase